MSYDTPIGSKLVYFGHGKSWRLHFKRSFSPQYSETKVGTSVSKPETLRLWKQSAKAESEKRLVQFPICEADSFKESSHSGNAGSAAEEVWGWVWRMPRRGTATPNVFRVQGVLLNEAHSSKCHPRVGSPQPGLEQLWCGNESGIGCAWMILRMMSSCWPLNFSIWHRSEVENYVGNSSVWCWWYSSNRKWVSGQ